MATTYRAYVKHLDTCDEIATLTLSRPAGFDFKAAQWLRLTLPTSEGSTTKTFTIACAPADDWLEITTRLSGSPFKVAFAQLEEGGEVDISGPGGRFHLPTDADRIVFLAGGVGITPVRSMLRDALNAGRTFVDAVIVYGNRNPECVPYAEELAGMRPSGVRVFDVFETASDSWEGARGFINASLVRDLVDSVDACVFFVTGPPIMVEAMERVLDELGVPSALRRVESFGPALR